jgi:hypothetical protein
MRFLSLVQEPTDARADIAPAHAESCIPFETIAERNR